MHSDFWNIKSREIQIRKMTIHKMSATKQK